MTVENTKHSKSAYSDNIALTVAASSQRRQGDIAEGRNMVKESARVMLQ